MKKSNKIIWQNEQAVKNYKTAYEMFIKSLKVKIEQLEPYTGKTIDEVLFYDILTGCSFVKKNLISETEIRIQKQEDPDIREILAEKLELKINKVDQISQEIEAAKSIKFNALDPVFIDAKLLIFNNGNITWNEQPIIEMYSIFIHSEIRQQLFEEANKIKSDIDSFEKKVQLLTKGQYHCIHSNRYSDRVFLSLDDNYGVNLDPFAIDSLEE